MVIILLFQFLEVFFKNYINFFIARLNMKIKSALISILFNKIMKISLLNNNKYSEGTVLNFVTVDIIKIEYVSNRLLMILNAVITFIIGFVIIYYIIDCEVIFILIS